MKPATSQKDKIIDYREVLDEKDFSIFAKLRILRKSLADQEGVPAYAVFTNEQLATMAREGINDLAALGSIKGVGKSRVEKYGHAVLDILKKETKSAAQTKPGLNSKDETDKN